MANKKTAMQESGNTGELPFDLPKVSAAEKQRAAKLLALLTAAYADAHCELNYTSPHELLVATILSAQTTDVGVNKATPALFAEYPTPADYAKATAEEIEPYVRTLGFFRNKARSVREAMTQVHEKHGGNVPRTMEELLALRGVARKTANVVLGNAFGINVGVVVDTHVERLSKRFDLVPQDANVALIEKRLMALFPRESWCQLSHMLIWHGRRACKARHVSCPTNPICEQFGSCCELRISAKSKKAAAASTKPAPTKPAPTKPAPTKPASSKPATNKPPGKKMAAKKSPRG